MHCHNLHVTASIRLQVRLFDWLVGRWVWLPDSLWVLQRKLGSDTNFSPTVIYWPRREFILQFDYYEFYNLESHFHKNDSYGTIYASQIADVTSMYAQRSWAQIAFACHNSKAIPVLQWHSHKLFLQSRMITPASVLKTTACRFAFLSVPSAERTILQLLQHQRGIILRVPDGYVNSLTHVEFCGNHTVVEALIRV